VSECQVNHSLTDGSMQVLTNIITLNLLQSHPLTRILHNIFITFLLTETHSGFDFPWMLHNVIPARILGLGFSFRV
jgi:sterol desaturase/sphingolipid hydroxylase (fatty acid hydroxylase superfamily)